EPESSTSAPRRPSDDRPRRLLVEQLEGGRLDLGLGEEHEARRVAEGDERVLARHPCETAAVARVEELGDKALPHAACPAVRADDEGAPGGGCLAQPLVRREGREPAEIDDGRADPALAQPAGDAKREVQTVCPRDDRQVLAAAMRVRSADGARVPPGPPEPQLVALLV